jgi:hypothetical protein
MPLNMETTVKVSADRGFFWAAITPLAFLERFIQGGLGAYQKVIMDLGGAYRLPALTAQDMVVAPLLRPDWTGQYGDPEGLLTQRHFVAGLDFLLTFHVIPERLKEPLRLNTWFVSAEMESDRSMRVTYRPEGLQPSASLFAHSREGRLERLDEITCAPMQTAERLSLLLSQLGPDCGREVAQRIELEAYRIATHPWDTLAPYATSPKPGEREVVAAVYSRLLAEGRPEFGGIKAHIVTVLKTMLSDPDQWVRIKAERGLGQSPFYARISPVANGCYNLKFAVERGMQGDAHKIGQCIRKRLVHRGTSRDILTDALDERVDSMPGWKDGELFLAGWEPGGGGFVPEYRWAVGIWPARGSRAFAFFAYEKRCSYCVYEGEFGSSQQAQMAIERMPRSFWEHRKCAEAGWKQLFHS